MLRHYQLDSEEQARRSASAAIQSDRLAAMQTLSAGLAHEVRNPLNAAKLQLELLERRLRRAARRPEAARADRARASRDRAADRAAQRVPRVRAPARAARRRSTDVVDDRAPRRSSSSARSPTAPARRARARRSRRPRDREGRLAASSTRSSRTSCAMALEATPAGGHVEVAVAIEATAALHIRVGDDGPGIPDDVLPRIYEPFFSTKESGTGMGMAIVHNFVAMHGGKIDIATVVARHAFDVELPAASNCLRGVRDRIGDADLVRRVDDRVARDDAGARRRRVSSRLHVVGEHRVDRDAHRRACCRRRRAGASPRSSVLPVETMSSISTGVLPAIASLLRRRDRHVAIAAPRLLEDHVRRAARLGDRARPTARSRHPARRGSAARPRRRPTARSPAPRARSSSGSCRCSSSESRRCRCGSTVTIQSTAPDTSAPKYFEVTPSPGLNWTSWRMNARYGATSPTLPRAEIARGRREERRQSGTSRPARDTATRRSPRRGQRGPRRCGRRSRRRGTGGPPARSRPCRGARRAWSRGLRCRGSRGRRSRPSQWYQAHSALSGVRRSRVGITLPLVTICHVLVLRADVEQLRAALVACEAARRWSGIFSRATANLYFFAKPADSCAVLGADDDQLVLVGALAARRCTRRTRSRRRTSRRAG